MTGEDGSGTTGVCSIAVLEAQAEISHGKTNSAARARMAEPVNQRLMNGYGRIPLSFPDMTGREYGNKRDIFCRPSIFRARGTQAVPRPTQTPLSIFLESQ